MGAQSSEPFWTGSIILLQNGLDPRSHPLKSADRQNKVFWEMIAHPLQKQDKGGRIVQPRTAVIAQIANIGYCVPPLYLLRLMKRHYGLVFSILLFALAACGGGGPASG